MMTVAAAGLSIITSRGSFTALVNLPALAGCMDGRDAFPKWEISHHQNGDISSSQPRIVISHYLGEMQEF